MDDVIFDGGSYKLLRLGLPDPHNWDLPGIDALCLELNREGSLLPRSTFFKWKNTQIRSPHFFLDPRRRLNLATKTDSHLINLIEWYRDDPQDEMRDFIKHLVALGDDVLEEDELKILSCGRCGSISLGKERCGNCDTGRRISETSIIKLYYFKQGIRHIFNTPGTIIEG